MGLHTNDWIRFVAFPASGVTTANARCNAGGTGTPACGSGMAGTAMAQRRATGVTSALIHGRAGRRGSDVSRLAGASLVYSVSRHRLHRVSGHPLHIGGGIGEEQRAEAPKSARLLLPRAPRTPGSASALWTALLPIRPGLLPRRE